MLRETEPATHPDPVFDEIVANYNKLPRLVVLPPKPIPPDFVNKEK